MLGSENRFWIFSEKKTWWVEFLGDSINWVDASTKKANLKDVKNIAGYDRKIKSNLSDDFYLFVKYASTRARASEQLLSVSRKNFKVDTLYDHSKS